MHLDLSWEEDEVEAEPPVRSHRNHEEPDDDRYLWFSTYVRPTGWCELSDAKRR
jgi:hypothetical protein